MTHNDEHVSIPLYLILQKVDLFLLLFLLLSFFSSSSSFLKSITSFINWAKHQLLCTCPLDGTAVSRNSIGAASKRDCPDFKGGKLSWLRTTAYTRDVQLNWTKGKFIFSTFFTLVADRPTSSLDTAAKVRRFWFLPGGLGGAASRWTMRTKHTH